METSSLTASTSAATFFAEQIFELADVRVGVLENVVEDAACHHGILVAGETQK